MRPLDVVLLPSSSSFHLETRTNTHSPALLLSLCSSSPRVSLREIISSAAPTQTGIHLSASDSSLPLVASLFDADDGNMLQTKMVTGSCVFPVVPIKKGKVRIVFDDVGLK